ncbi:MAG: hypothetical protein DRN96_03955 [Thermoproteota archaeon]|nr:MAG: hypothetical protein DRN96_03955 [Candidatus Korarchaeota archaeon]RLG55262.1 MAG: hypothetical protein DRN99_03170 [Candidatus Korarchaeota archaeon]
MAMRASISPIGVIRSPFKRVEDVPWDYSQVEGEIHIYPEYRDGLRDLDGFSHVIVLWLFHLARGESLLVKPLYDSGVRGVFATRHPNRPNRIALTVMELLAVRESSLRVRGVDAVDGSPVVDIKPYTFKDRVAFLRLGWLARVFSRRADESAQLHRLVSLAAEAMKAAYAPYSKFRVGAAVLASSGAVYTGCNIENASYGLTVCAERVAVFKAISEGERGIRAVAVVTEAEKPTPPCGACRQVIYEHGPSAVVVMANTRGDMEVASIRDLLPKAFSSSDLSSRASAKPL